ncbi:class A beta-lactamase [Streptomyces sioyaensis]|uniref:class A beta-lactamase n=1 Tax=Streptomyces sioyaensis TaxID=67364 RepID=UPI001EFF1FA3|nr:class A beta-lactamase [Streptomyces sioyaensis]MCF3177487.1 class A beta-lactamase [Streptomyces sioyaensis]
MYESNGTPTVPTRRALLGAGAGLLTAGLLAGSTVPAAAQERTGGAHAALRRLERAHRARVGAFAHNTATGATVAYRADTRVPLCSVFKTLAVGAVLRDLDHHGETLARRVHYTAADLVANSPVTSAHLATGMTIADLCAAALQRSDNTAANLLLRTLGGPTAVTAFARSLGDRTTRLDRWEPDLNSAEPWRTTDTTTPAAIARTYTRLLLGDALTPADRARLTAWMKANKTNTDRFRAALPQDWTLADKTGTGSYGTANDVGVAWTPDGTPIVLAVLTGTAQQAAPSDDPLVADVTRVLAQAVTG